MKGLLSSDVFQRMNVSAIELKMDDCRQMEGISKLVTIRPTRD